jgi:preprotein translocase subunit SecE
VAPRSDADRDTNTDDEEPMANREFRRRRAEQEQQGTQDESARPRREEPVHRERTAPAEYVREVRGELRKVAWPNRAETLNYSAVVGVTLVLVTSLIFVLDFVFSDIVQRIFNLK